MYFISLLFTHSFHASIIHDIPVCNNYIVFLFSAAFLTQTVCLDDTTVKFEIWDTAGQENILFISTMFSNICLLIQLDLELKSRVLNFSIFVVHDSGY